MWRDDQGGRNGDRAAQREKALLGRIKCEDCNMGFVADATGYKSYHVHFIREHAPKFDREIGCDIASCAAAIKVPFSDVYAYKRHVDRHAKNLGYDEGLNIGFVPSAKVTNKTFICPVAGCPRPLRNWSSEEFYRLHVQLTHPLTEWEHEIRKAAPHLSKIDGFDPFLDPKITKNHKFFENLTAANRALGKLRPQNREDQKAESKNTKQAKSREQRTRKPTANLVTAASVKDLKQILGRATPDLSDQEDLPVFGAPISSRLRSQSSESEEIEMTFGNGKGRSTHHKYRC
ncbi:hypothetical protein ONS96_004846 [Cadophora gregata f. sp. sojae]|nr:hypothetical protein ONS96_004846 [Cadophora gregata f. sp. sojae]